MPISNTKLENALTKDVNVYVCLSMHVKHYNRLIKRIREILVVASLRRS